MNQRTIQMIEEMLKVDGVIEEGLLDDFVHATASEVATTINNEGVQGQIEYLLDNNWSGEDILFEVKAKREEGE